VFDIKLKTWLRDNLKSKAKDKNMKNIEALIKETSSHYEKVILEDILLKTRQIKSFHLELVTNYKTWRFKETEGIVFELKKERKEKINHHAMCKEMGLYN
jgi:hypothetical protein